MIVLRTFWGQITHSVHCTNFWYSTFVSFLYRIIHALFSQQELQLKVPQTLAAISETVELLHDASQWFSGGVKEMRVNTNWASILFCIFFGYINQS